MASLLSTAMAAAAVSDKAGADDAMLSVEPVTAGDGVTRPAAGDKLCVHYIGSLVSDGSVFDSSRDKGEPFEFTLDSGQVVKGFDRGVGKLSLGERAIIKMKAAYGYGAKGCTSEEATGTGKIPPDSDLQFDVELLDINGKRSVALLSRYKKMLEEHVSTKLAAFDTDAKVRAAKSKKYNDRAGYLAFLTASKDKKYAAEAAKVAAATTEAGKEE